MEINELTLPRIFTPREFAKSAAAPSLLFDVIRSASSLASTAFFSRSVFRSLSTRSESVFFALSNLDLADSNCESRPSSLESALAISNSKVEYARDASSARCWASLRDFSRRAISSAIASSRARKDFIWPSCRAVPSRASAIARIAAATLSSSLFSEVSACAKALVASVSERFALETAVRSSDSSCLSACASRSRASGSRPSVRASSASSAKKRERSCARDAVPLNLSRKELS